MIFSRKKFVNKVYAITEPSIHHTGVGVSMIVLVENKKNVGGITMFLDGSDTFKLPINDFQRLIDSKKIEYLDSPPQDIIDELNQVFTCLKAKEC
jgi:hypothetical protein